MLTNKKIKEIIVEKGFTPYKNERFKQIEECEGYCISDYGRCWSLKTNRFMKPDVTYQGYLRYHLCINGLMKKFAAHRLTAIAFVKNSNPEEFIIVCHKDDVKNNNYYKNLFWGTTKINVNWNDCPQRISAGVSKTIYKYDLDYNLIDTYSNYNDLKAQTGLPAKNSVYRHIKNGKPYRNYYWTHAPITQGEEVCAS